MSGTRYLLLGLLLWGCSDADDDATGDAGPPDAGPERQATPFDPVAELDTAYLFDQAEVRNYELLLEPDQLAILDADPAAEEYVEGRLRFEGEEYGPVGIRYKGSYGAFRPCVESDVNLVLSGAKTCERLSMKVDINYVHGDALFYGVRKLQFHAMTNDNSLVRERLGYTLFAEGGIATPRAAHVMLTINGQNAGLYLLVEQIDGRFTRDRFADEGGEGNLYKEAWPVHDMAEAYLTRLETNEDEDPDVTGMLDFAADIVATPETELEALLDRHLDPDHGFRYVAIDRALHNDDGIFHLWCMGAPTSPLPWFQIPIGNNICGNHNYYWYQEASTQKMWLVPWDMDFILPSINGGTQLAQQLGVELAAPWDEPRLNCTEADADPDLPAGCDKLNRAFASSRARYLMHLQEFLDGPFAKAHVDELLLAWGEQLRPLLPMARAGAQADVTPEYWERQFALLGREVEARRTWVQQELDRGP